MSATTAPSSPRPAAVPGRAGDTPSRGPWIVGAALFVTVFVLAHQRPFDAYEPAAWSTLAGSVMVWAGVLPWLLLWWLAAAGYGGVLQRGLFPSDRPHAGKGGCHGLQSVPSTGLHGLRSVAPCTGPDARIDSALTLPLGGATLMLLTWLTQWLVGLGRVSMIVVLLAGLALLIRTHAGTLAAALRAERVRTPALPWSAAISAAPLAMLAVAVTLPAGTLWRVEAYGYDVLSYHLNVPKQWFDAGGMVALRHDVYGYLPNLVEATFGLFFALRGSASPDAVYLCQGFHASWALLAAAQVGRGVFGLTQSKSAAWTSAAVLLAVPWVLITGSMAYNEMVVLALAAAAWRVVVADEDALQPWARGVGVGLLVGAATLAKLTAGFMVAVPLGIALLTGFAWRRTGKEIKPSLFAASVAGVVGVAVLSPYLVRNAAWTGNPVFPFAAEHLGQGHWDDTLVQRWNAGHGLAEGAGFDATALPRQWLLNTGYGAIGGTATPVESQNIARFDREYGVPVLWLAALAGVVVAFREPRWRRPAGVLLAWLGFQLVTWHVVTHLQSRFLVTTLVSGVLLVGFALATREREVSRAPGPGHSPGPAASPTLGARFVTVALPVVLVALLGSVSLNAFWQQTVTARDLMTGASAPLPPWFLADAFAVRDHPLHPSQHPVNALPPGPPGPSEGATMIVADTSRLFYLDGPVRYASAFDASPLGYVIEAAGGDPARVAELLHEQGVTHLWVGWSELRRLHATYGHDARVSEAGLSELVRGWPVVVDVGGSALYAVPENAAKTKQTQKNH